MTTEKTFSWKGKKVLITGASGFKGSWLSKVLLKLGAEVYGTISSHISPLSAYYLLNLDKEIIQVECDISTPQQVTDVLNSIAPDTIFHLAAKALVPASLRDPRRTFDVNIMGTINILEGCRLLKVGRRLLVVSTDHVFGHVLENQLDKLDGYEKGFVEDARVSYGGPYDTSKSAMELCVRSYHYTYWNQLPAVGISRAANVFGYGDVGARRVIPLFVNSALNKGKIDLKYRLNGRQFIYLSDIVEGYIRAVENLNDDDRLLRDNTIQQPISRSPFTPTFHFALEDYSKWKSNKLPQSERSEFIRMRELGTLAETIGGAKLVETDECCDYAPNENQVQALNCNKTREMLKWKPKVTLEEGIKRVYKWYSNMGNEKTLKSMLEEDIQVIIDSLK